MYATFGGVLWRVIALNMLLPSKQVIKKKKKKKKTWLVISVHGFVFKFSNGCPWAVIGLSSLGLSLFIFPLIYILYFLDGAGASTCWKGIFVWTSFESLVWETFCYNALWRARGEERRNEPRRAEVSEEAVGWWWAAKLACSEYVARISAWLWRRVNR